MDRAALDGVADGHPADDRCPLAAASQEPYHAKLRDRGCAVPYTEPVDPAP